MAPSSQPTALHPFDVAVPRDNKDKAAAKFNALDYWGQFDAAVGLASRPDVKVEENGVIEYHLEPRHRVDERHREGLDRPAARVVGKVVGSHGEAAVRLADAGAANGPLRLSRVARRVDRDGA